MRPLIEAFPVQKVLTSLPSDLSNAGPMFLVTGLEFVPDSCQLAVKMDRSPCQRMQPYAKRFLVRDWVKSAGLDGKG